MTDGRLPALVAGTDQSYQANRDRWEQLVQGAEVAIGRAAGDRTRAWCTIAAELLEEVAGSVAAASPDALRLAALVAVGVIDASDMAGAAALLIRPVQGPPRDAPRLVQELCEGHPEVVAEVFALDLPGGVRLWLCRSCWIRQWNAAGQPGQTAKGDHMAYNEYVNTLGGSA